MVHGDGHTVWHPNKEVDEVTTLFLWDLFQGVHQTFGQAKPTVALPNGDCCHVTMPVLLVTWNQVQKKNNKKVLNLKRKEISKNLTTLVIDLEMKIFL